MDIFGKWVYNRTINQFREGFTMKQKLLSAVLAAAVFCTAAIPAVSASEERSLQNVPTVSDAPLAQAAFDETSVYNAMIALQDEYPDGMEWTNDNFYIWNGGGPYSGGYGCVAFAFILSDAAFGDLPARQVNTLDLSVIRVGDIIRYSGHSVIVLEVHEDYVVVAEGNINSSVMWGRKVSLDEMSGGFEHYLTRYPEEEETTESAETETTAETTTTAVEITTTETTTTETTERSLRGYGFGLEKVSDPYKMTYALGEELDLTGLVVNGLFQIIYSDNTTETEVVMENIDHDLLTVTGFDSSVAGECTVQISCDYAYGDDILTSRTSIYIKIVDSKVANLGDVDINGVVDAADAADLLVAAAAIGAGNDSGLNETQTANADVDGNGVLDATDAAWILRYAAYIGAGGDAAMEEFFAQNV